MSGLLLMVVIILFVPMGAVLFNKTRCKGKLLCTILKDDKSTDTKLCRLDGGFVIYGDRAYDVYPDWVRVTRYPSGWPPMLQELVPHALYDEKDAIPLRWIQLSNRTVRSMELKSSLDENFFKKLVSESVKEGKIGFNWRKALPFVLVIAGVLGLVYMLMMR